MARSPFAFLRGSADLMAADLAATPTTGTRVQLGGDAHLANFGIFGTPERAQVFDLDDFDETLPGPWEWDVRRLATSVVLAGRERGWARGRIRRATQAAARAYREGMSTFAKMRYLDIWYSHLEPSADPLPIPVPTAELVDRGAERAGRRDGFHAFPKLVRAVRGAYRIRDRPPLIVHNADPERNAESRSFYERYLTTLAPERRMLLERYRVVDVAQKVVGVGSVGTACAVLLLMADRDVPDPLLLQLKEAGPSCLERYWGASAFGNHAERVVNGQRMIQEASDAWLGWSRLRARDYYVRELRDMKFSYDASTFGPKAFFGYAALCGYSLARAHARTGDPAVLSGYLGERDVFDTATARFAESYADQVERDHQALRQAIRTGRLAAHRNG